MTSPAAVGDSLSCPVCGAPTGTQLFVATGDDVARHFFGTLTDPRAKRMSEHASLLWGRPASRFMDCSACGFGFADPFVAGDGEFYRLGYGADAFYPAWKWEFEVSLEAIRRRVASQRGDPLTLLDIGAGSGAFVSRVLDAGIDRGSMTCLEYSETGLGAIRDLGIEGISADLRHTDGRGFEGAFDIVCFFQVLEHLDDLEGFFGRLSQVTRPGADLFLAVPNADQRAFLDRYGMHEDLPPAHVGRWSVPALRMVAERHGFSLVETRTEPETFRARVSKFLRLRTNASGPGRLINRMRAQLPRRAMKALVFPVVALLNVPALARLRKDGLGTSRWAHLRRESPSIS